MGRRTVLSVVHPGLCQQPARARRQGGILYACARCADDGDIAHPDVWRFFKLNLDQVRPRLRALGLIQCCARILDTAPGDFVNVTRFYQTSTM